jgi:hypothetical protein
MPLLSDHIAAISRSSVDPYAETLATIFLDSSIAHLSAGDGPQAWEMVNEAIRILLGKPPSPSHLPKVVRLATVEKDPAYRAKDLFLILDTALHVCPWVRIHVVLAAMAPWHLPTSSSGEMRPPRKVRELVVGNGASGCEEVLTSWGLMLRDSPCSQMGDCLETLLTGLASIPRRPGSSPWAVAIFAHYCLSHEVVGPVAERLIGSAKVC